MQRCQEAPYFRVQVSVHNTHHLISICRVGRVWHLILKKHKLKKEKALPTFARMIFEKQQRSSVTHDFLKTTQEHTHSLPSPYATVAGFMLIRGAGWGGQAFLEPRPCWTLLCLTRPPSWAATGSTCSPEETTVWSWSGRCQTSSGCSPIQAVMPASGPWPCLTTKGNTGMGAILVAVKSVQGFM